MIISIQILRALAALLVVSQHILYKYHAYGFNSLPNFQIGNYGVDLFFIISGYIICQATYGKKQPPYIFIKNRLCRILPLYWLLSLIALTIYILRPDLVNSSGGETDILSSFLLIPTDNKYLVQNGWTLSYELFFYCTFSLSLSFRLWGQFFTVSSIFMLIAAYTHFNHSEYSFFFNNSLFIEFLFGMICFNIRHKISSINIKATFIIYAMLILLLTYEIKNPTSEIFKNGRFIYAGIPMLLFFVATLSLEKYMINHQDVKLLIFLRTLGDASYSLYLSHAFVLSAAAMITYKVLSNGVIFLGSLFVSAIVTSLVCYHFVEKHMTNYLKNQLLVRG